MEGIIVHLCPSISNDPRVLWEQLQTEEVEECWVGLRN